VQRQPHQSFRRALKHLSRIDASALYRFKQEFRAVRTIKKPALSSGPCNFT